MSDLLNVMTGEQIWDAIHSPDETTRREIWTKMLEGERHSDPHWVEDTVEYHVQCCDPGSQPLELAYGDHEYAAETTFEAQFLVYLTQALKRGDSFEDAFSRAVGLIRGENDVSRVIYELKMDEVDDKCEVELWTKRLTDLGVEPDRASILARDATALLRQVWLTRDDNFYGEDWLTEQDVEDRKILLQKLAS
jgi:hypothetical protein